MAYENNTVAGDEVYGLFTTTIREQLEDVIYILQDLRYPYLKGLGKVKAFNKMEEWLMDHIPVDKVIANIKLAAKTEGRDAEFTTQDPPVRLWAPVQINAKSWATTGTDRVVQKAGRNDDHKYFKLKFAKQLAHELEMAAHFGVGAFIEGTTNAANTAGTNVRLMHGVVPWLFTTGLDRAGAELDPLANGANTKLWSGTVGTKVGGPVFDAIKYGSVIATSNLTGVAGSWSAATSTPLTRHILEKEFLGAWTDRGGIAEGAVITVGSALRRAISGFGFPNTGNVPVNYREIPAEMRGLYTSIDWIATGVGTVYIGQDQFLNGTDAMSVNYALARSPEEGAEVAFAINPSTTIICMQRGFLKWLVLRGAHTEVLAKIGDKDNATMRTEIGFQVKHPLALCGGTGWTEAVAPA